MILRPEPVAAALDALRREGSTAILLDPVGEVFRQARAADLAGRSHLVFVCPRYEGVDERIRSTGRPRAVDRRLRPDRRRAAGPRRHRRRHPPAPRRHRDASTVEESFADGLLEYPQYTRPAVFRGEDVPAILTSGDHGAVARWRREQAIERTRARRPDLAPGD